MDRSRPGSWVLHSPSPLGPQQRTLKPQAENHSRRGVVPRTPTSSTEVPTATGRRPTTPAPPAAPRPARGNGPHGATGQPQTQGAASHPARSRSNSPYQDAVTRPRRPPSWRWGRTPSQWPLSSNARGSRDPGPQRHTERQQAVGVET